MRFLTLILALLSSLCHAESVFKLYSNNGHQEWTATAFAIDDHHLLTAAHTFGFTTARGYGKHFIVRDGKFEEVTIAKIDYDKDICILEDKQAFSEWYGLASSSKSPGQINAIGFPGKSITTITANWKKSGKYLDTDRDIINGMSGCPMVNEAGLVAGMGVNGDGKRCHSVPCEKLSAFIKQ